jgi:hypothetical protein
MLSSSSSITDAISFCREILNLPEFKNIEATRIFIQTIDRHFDISNSRNPFGRGYKAAMKPANESWIKEFFVSAENYLRNLSDVQTRFLISSTSYDQLFYLLSMYR